MKQIQIEKNEKKCYKKLFKQCTAGRDCLQQLEESLSSLPKYKQEIVSNQIVVCKLKLDYFRVKIQKKKNYQESQKHLIHSSGSMIQSIKEQMTEMERKVKNQFENNKLEDLVRNISDMHIKMSDFIEKKFKVIENETKKEKEQADKNQVVTAGQIHNEAEITIQSYKHLQHAKEQYVSQIDKIREVRRLHIFQFISDV